MVACHGANNAQWDDQDDRNASGEYQKLQSVFFMSSLPITVLLATTSLGPPPPLQKRQQKRQDTTTQAPLDTFSSNDYECHFVGGAGIFD